MKRNYPPEFEHKEITTSRIEFAEISARVVNDTLSKLSSLPDEDIADLRMLLTHAEVSARVANDILDKLSSLSDDDIMALRMLLTIFSADIMTELFDNDLEVEE